MKLAQFRIASTAARDSAQPSIGCKDVSPRIRKSPADQVAHLQMIVTELISLFQEYRDSVEDRLEAFSDLGGLEGRLFRRMDEKVAEAQREIHAETNRTLTDQLHRLDSLGFLDIAVKNCLARELRGSQSSVDRWELDAIKDELRAVQESQLELLSQLQRLSNKDSGRIKSLRVPLINLR